MRIRYAKAEAVSRGRGSYAVFACVGNRVCLGEAKYNPNGTGHSWLAIPLSQRFVRRYKTLRNAIRYLQDAHSIRTEGKS